jgi:hypothetical protein
MVSYTQGSVIGYNELTDMPYSGVSVGWGWADVDNVARDNVVRYNRVWNMLHTEAAGGGLYTLSRQARTLLAENYIFDIVRLGLRDQRDLPGRGEQSHHGAGQRLREHRRCGSSSQCARSRQRVFPCRPPRWWPTRASNPSTRTSGLSRTDSWVTQSKSGRIRDHVIE